jgi:hypothetical protein
MIFGSDLPKHELTFRSAILSGLVVFAGVGIGLLARGSPAPWFRLGAESVMYYLVMLAVSSQQPLKNAFRSAPKYWTLALVGIVTMMIASQIIGSTPKTYPLTSWAMYSDRSSGAVIFDFEAVHASGRKSNLLPASGFLPPRTFNNTLQHFLEIELGNSPRNSKWPDSPGTSYRDLCERVALLTPGAVGDPVVRVNAWRCWIKADTRQPENTVRRELVHQLDLTTLGP